MSAASVDQERILHLWRQGFRHAGHPVHSLREIRRILIVKPSALGDIVHSLPLLGALRGNFPDAWIAWLVHKDFAAVLAGNGALDEVISWDRGRWDSTRRAWESLLGFGRFLRAIELGGFDLVIDLQGLFRSGLMSYATGAPVRVGFRSARELSHKFYNVRVDGPGIPMHAVDRYLLLADRLHLRRVSVDFPIVVDADARRRMRERFADVRDARRPLVLVSPAARWPSKEWTIDGFAYVAGALVAERRAKVVFAGTARERSRADRIRARVGGDAVNLAGETSLKELVALLADADLFLTNDSGPMHIADALATPLVAVFGPTDPARTGPYRQRRHVVCPPDLDCAPCLRRYCSDRRCMEAIDPPSVLRLALKVLDREA
ncbi:MAG: lipopolysaccharide heptosyltransferase II [Planctomycetota bacterium]